jgi:hypothetical protein
LLDIKITPYLLAAQPATVVRMQIQPRDHVSRRKHGAQLQLCVPQVAAEGASDRALALFSFPSLARYESYRQLFGVDPEFIAADRIRDESGCVLRYERTFMRPLLSP